MNDIKFSVVIPTRERPATLRQCLRTCLNQNFDNYEVLVSDNGAIPATRAVVDEAASPKIRYVKTPRPLSLASSWEFAVAHARGEYVLVIGDDDGLLPHGLFELDKLIRSTGHKVIRWDAAFYTWPNIALAGEEDYLRIPQGTRRVEVDAVDAIQEVISFRQLYTILPMIYNSAIHRDVLAAIRFRTGRVFANRYADVYSGFSTAYVAGKYLSVDMPISISGQSGSSTGVAIFFFRDRSPIDRDFRNLSDGEILNENKQVPNLSIFPHTAVADSFLDAKRLLFPNLDRLVLDQKLFIGCCAKNLLVVDAQERNKALKMLRDCMPQEPGDLEWFDEQAALLESHPPAPFRLKPHRFGFDGNYLHLNAAAFGVRDISGAADLCDRILNYREYGIPEEAVSDGSTPIVLSRLQHQHRVLHDVCAELKNAADERLKVVEILSSRVRELEKRQSFPGMMKAILAKIHSLMTPFGSRASRPH